MCGENGINGDEKKTPEDLPPRNMCGENGINGDEKKTPEDLRLETCVWKSE